ncbi:hypothetical protein LZ198_40320 [Myxococcus sp. K15C18031901]|uniref:hypothetical protein n=1 Tax=Myxococcus dinghuensis TaxID=2906761 RepID=UPI0020A76CE2|nr:hypothetical protein [Myxococcus dinghuensis]MCP3105132.1 hypothetical protein [Myxococcus dinghuensis]
MRSIGRFIALGVLLGVVGVARAQESASGPPRTLAGVCGTANWVCVAECIDADCIDQCMREGCEEALSRLKSCTAKAGCAPEDSRCSARRCASTCQQAFEPAPPSPEKEVGSPCGEGRLASSTSVPKDLVGTWRLAAASLPDVDDGRAHRIEPQPRADYARSLLITPEGCFVLSTALKDATLGEGNSLAVRAWGTVEVVGKDTLRLRTRDGQAVGPVCGEARVIPLSRGKLRFRGGTYLWEMERHKLTLTVDDRTKQTFQFDRVRSAK